MVLLTYFLEQPVWFQGFGQDRLPEDMMPRVGRQAGSMVAIFLPLGGPWTQGAAAGGLLQLPPPRVPRQGKVKSHLVAWVASRSPGGSDCSMSSGALADLTRTALPRVPAASQGLRPPPRDPRAASFSGTLHLLPASAPWGCCRSEDSHP